MFTNVIKDGRDEFLFIQNFEMKYKILQDM